MVAERPAHFRSLHSRAPFSIVGHTHVPPNVWIVYEAFQSKPCAVSDMCQMCVVPRAACRSCAMSG